MLSLFDPLGEVKGMRFEPWFKAVKEKRLLPPIQACVNPIHACDLACLDCDLANLGEGEEVTEVMEDGHLLRVVGVLLKWGVKAVTFGTVGEPTLHKDFVGGMIAAKVGKMDVSVVTNGVGMTDYQIEQMAGLCSNVWIRISSATTGKYEKRTGRRFLDRVLERVGLLRERMIGKKGKLGWLFEMDNMNVDETLDACRVAKNKGFDVFYARVLKVGAYGNRLNAAALTAGLDETLIGLIRKGCEREESGSFQVRVEDKIERGGFHQCYAAPLTIHIGADGYVYHCADQYGNPEYCIGEHHPEPEEMMNAWGGDKHAKLLYTDTPFWCDVACSMREYHRMARRLVWEDPDPLRQYQIIR